MTDTTSALTGLASTAAEKLDALIGLGGPALVAIAALSVIGTALILWKFFSLVHVGAFSGSGRAERAIRDWEAGDRAAARALLSGRMGVRARLATQVMSLLNDPGMPEGLAREETARAARALLASARSGLRGLELTVTIGPLLGLLGTVTGMISAFQALQQAGTRADPATLAGGIWEALLTTAAGMAVAIPAQVALTWFESRIEALRHDMEDQATRLFVATFRTRGASHADEDATSVGHHEAAA